MRWSRNVCRLGVVQSLGRKCFSGRLPVKLRLFNGTFMLRAIGGRNFIVFIVILLLTVNIFCQLGKRVDAIQNGGQDIRELG
jgi:hypothetical protein